MALTSHLYYGRKRPIYYGTLIYITIIIITNLILIVIKKIYLFIYFFNYLIKKLLERFNGNK